MTILFWNLNNNDVENVLIEMIKENNCDIVILAECKIDLITLCNKINFDIFDDYVCYYEHKPINKSNRLRILKRKRIRFEVLDDSSDYFRIDSLEYDEIKLIIASVHFVSKLRNNEEEVEEIARNLHRKINEKEKLIGHDFSIAVGDFNANPFEEAIVSASCLHGVPFKEEVKEERIVNGEPYKMFYNPMWKVYARSKPPYGTYHYNTSKLVNFYWNIFDQVIIRPSLIDMMNYDCLNIITKVGDYALVNEACRPIKEISDHLPIIFEIKEEY